MMQHGNDGMGSMNTAAKRKGAMSTVFLDLRGRSTTLH
jgi:hypothetical protein